VVTVDADRGRMQMNNAFDPEAAGTLDEATRALIERRARLLGPAYRLFYKEPIHFVRGKGSRLWDAQGNEYLDAYNNVVSVGHAHPAVVEAVHRQMTTLCTHTRYLQEGILDYAEQLLETFGGAPGAQHLMMTCTGSEANDLATRIAKHSTGNQGIIVTSEAYHGNSECTAGFSPSLGDNSPLGTWVRRVPAPDSYRIRPADLAAFFEYHVREAIADLRRHGQGVAALIVDSLFSSDGIYAHPTALLSAAVGAVHDAGGLFIADEVQSGFARSGDAMWGYQRHGVSPDIVTMGKPMGNGYPVAGVVVAHDVVAEFGRELRYFNTFGGNSVAVAAAQATLNVIDEERLLRNVRATGADLLGGLDELAQRHYCIGDVRGAGFYIGVEIVSDRDRKTPDTQLAGHIVNGLRDRRVLISATGPAGNVLKIRPPLVFNGDDAARFLETLEDTLAVVGAGIGSGAR
jgi:4-aminobutyrate aminotransferase-like enzyme